MLTSSTCTLHACRHFPDIHVIRGRARHPQTQGGVESTNKPFKQAMQQWLQENQTTDWATIGVHIVNQRINFRPRRNRDNLSPYELYYGQALKGSPLDDITELRKLPKTELGQQRAFDLFADGKHPSTEEVRAAIEAGDAEFFAEEARQTSSASPDTTSAAQLPPATDDNNSAGIVAESLGTNEANNESAPRDKEAEVPAVAAAAVGATAEGVEAGRDELQDDDDDDGGGGKLPAVDVADVVVGTAHVTGPPAAATKTPLLCQPVSPADADSRKRDASEASLDTDPSDISPRRSALRARAAASQAEQARRLNSKRATFTKPFLEKGDICNLKIDGNVRGATDMPNIPVAVSLVQPSKNTDVPPKYKIATRDGFLKGYFQRDRLVHYPSTTMEIMGIDLESPKMRHDLSDALASALFNASGGGASCGCKVKDCATNKKCTCNCRGQFCTSKCHGGRGKHPNCTLCPPSDSDLVP